MRRDILNICARVLLRKYHVHNAYRILIKNLFLGYLFSTTSDKSSVLRVFANVLDFTESEKDKTGLNDPSRLGKTAASLKVYIEISVC